MSDWLTRAPTKHDADANGKILIPHEQSWVEVNYEEVQQGEPWYPLPGCYVEPISKRECVTTSAGTWITILDTDPDNWDILLSEIDNPIEEPWTSEDMALWLFRIQESRKPK